jgi:predicted ATP-grasp superfamily ATP-dependent carboligase
MVSPATQPTRISVLALGSGITLLGVLRSLSKSGFDVYALPDVDDLPRRSRWYRPAPSAFAGVRGENLVGALSSLPTRTVLLPCSDYWVTAVAGLSSSLREKYPASVPPSEALRTLVDKAEFRASLTRLSLPHPRTRVVSKTSDLDGIPDDVLRQSFLKPAHSQQFFAHFGVKAFRISDRQDACIRLSACTAAGFEMMLQEYIPGPATSHFFLDGFIDRHGIRRALFARQRLRMSPPDFGNSTSMISVPTERVASGVATLEKLFADIKFRGVFSAEFKRDERDSSLKLIEVNARPWWYVEFAARCGVNVCEMAVRDALGEDVTTVGEYETGRRCVFPYYDFEAVRAEIREHRMNSTAWVRSWIGPYQPVFRWTDVWPAFGGIALLLRRRLKRTFTA